MLSDFSWKFEAGIYIQKAWHFAVHEVFMYKNPKTSQKTRQLALRFYVQKCGHFALRNFSLNFWNCLKGRGHFYMQKTIHFALHLYTQKKYTFRNVFTYKSVTHYVAFLYAKNNSICVKFLYLNFFV